MELGLAGTVVVVFGAARGIGAAIAQAFAAEAATVVAVDRDPSVLEWAGPHSGDVLGHRPALGLVADVTDFAAVRRAAGEVAQRCGCCDHVVFAVGVGSGKFGFPFWKRRETLSSCCF
jgi:NAD(P)-dependent dehydrogenase (short-subunit alcohol dehydrogenase family)